MILVGIADSGIDGPAAASVRARADFSDQGSSASENTMRDGARHGSAIGAVIAAIDGVALLDARIFDARLRAGTAQAAAAIDWLVARGARILNLSFGMREDDRLLREACHRALEAGVLIVASVPARGEPVFPGSYPGVIRATGDARCTDGAISWLGTAQADAGGAPRTPCGRVAGASAGCAHVSAALARLMVQCPEAGRQALLEALRASARHHGPERRQS